MTTLTRYAPHGAVAAANHLAASAGLAALSHGGNAVDAAIAAAAVMAVTSPQMCGLGGDLFALVAVPGGQPVALNASGHSGSGANARELRAEGFRRMPFQGDVRAVTVPGFVDGLIALHTRYARLSLGALLRPAERLAGEGFPVSPTLAEASAELAGDCRRLAFGSEDRLVRGRRIRRPGLARTLHAVASDGRAAFYEGPVGEDLRELGGDLFSEADLQRVQADWVAPLSLMALGRRLWTAPPNSQGYLALAGAWIAEAVGIPDDPDSELWAFTLVEAARQAAYDRREVLHENADGELLLGRERLQARADAVRDRAARGLSDAYAGGGTTYLCAIDEERMGVSLIASNAAEFGSHLVLPRNGVFLHNRGMGFSLLEGHPAEYQPGRRPPHTLSPLAITREDGALEAVMGTMGADAQPQVLLQLLARTLMSSQLPGDALEAPRWYLSRDEPTGFGTWSDGDDDPPIVQIEHNAPDAWEAGLRKRGYHVVRSVPNDQSFGHSQLILLTEHNMLCGAADPRTADGACAGY